jgi:hypothetical protein
VYHGGGVVQAKAKQAEQAKIQQQQQREAEVC